MKKLFQSYLISGNELAIKEELSGLAQKFTINLKLHSPDIFIISPIKNYITIDQIRQLKSHIFQKPIHLKYKLVIIEQADRATHEAQNALLKILEEPPLSAIIVLLAQDKTQLLPTIRSRVVEKKVYRNKPEIAGDLDILTTIKRKNLTQLLEEISSINEPVQFLNYQIMLLYSQLKKTLTGEVKYVSFGEITYAFEKCAQTIAMIDANVNPKFALANLIFSLKLNF